MVQYRGYRIQNTWFRTERIKNTGYMVQYRGYRIQNTWFRTERIQNTGYMVQDREDTEYRIRYIDKQPIRGTIDSLCISSETSRFAMKTPTSKDWLLRGFWNCSLCF